MKANDNCMCTVLTIIAIPGLIPLTYHGFARMRGL